MPGTKKHPLSLRLYHRHCGESRNPLQSLHRHQPGFARDAAASALQWMPACAGMTYCL